MLSMYHELKKYSSWKICSLDSDSNISMVENENIIINFDHVKRQYLNSLGNSEECAASVDALCEDNNEHIYMIEFKNGAINSENIRNKLIESLLIFTDITHLNLDFARKNIDFIIVYNPDKINFSYSDLRAIYLAKLGNKPCPLYKLDKYPGFCVQKAYLMPVASFNESMIDKLSVK